MMVVGCGVGYPRYHSELVVPMGCRQVVGGAKQFDRAVLPVVARGDAEMSLLFRW